MHCDFLTKPDQYLLFFIDFLAEAKCGGRPLVTLIQYLHYWTQHSYELKLFNKIECNKEIIENQNE